MWTVNIGWGLLCCGLMILVFIWAGAAVRHRRCCAPVSTGNWTCEITIPLS